MTLVWRDKTPVSERFDDPYFSLNGGLEETQHVFINGNRLPERWKDVATFHVAELGFGTGLNALATWQAFEQDNPQGHLTFTSFERYPLGFDDICKALEPFDGLHDKVSQLESMTCADGVNTLHADRITLHLIVGDANALVGHTVRGIDAWCLDGFSPAKNPELWNLSLMQQVYTATHPQGTFATYTAAGWVRRMLAEAGFTVHRAPGFGFKRHMSVGCKGP